MRLTTAAGRSLDVTDEVQPVMGRVVYRVAGVGAFTIERDPDGYSVDPSRDRLHCVYGVLTAERYYSYRGALPEAPVVFGITLGGAAVFGPERFTEEEVPDDRSTWRWPLPMQRASETDVRGSVPDGTAKRVTDIVGALVLAYLDRPDRLAIEDVQAVRLAPQRLNSHQRTIDRLSEEIHTLQARLDHERSLADVQAAFLAPNVDATLGA